MLERTTQPMTDAVIERPQTLVEKLEQVITEHNAEFNKIIKDATDHQKIAHTAVLAGLLSAIKVAKQHQAESVWVSVDERLPEREYCEYLVWVGYPDIATYSKFGWELPSDAVVTHWMPLQKPPSEVQDETA